MLKILHLLRKGTRRCIRSYSLASMLVEIPLRFLWKTSSLFCKEEWKDSYMEFWWKQGFFVLDVVGRVKRCSILLSRPLRLFRDSPGLDMYSISKKIGDVSALAMTSVVSERFAVRWIDQSTCDLAPFWKWWSGCYYGLGRFHKHIEKNLSFLR